MPRARLPNPFRQTSKSWTLELGDANKGHPNQGFIPADDSPEVRKGGALKGTRSTPTSSTPSKKDASDWDKFKLLLWKNYKIQSRHKVQTVVEITFPILFTIIVIAVRCILQPRVVPGPISFPDFRVDDAELLVIPQVCCSELYYAPNNAAVERLMSRVHANFFNASSPLPLKFTGFMSEADLVDNYVANTASLLQNETGDGEVSSTVLAGVVFTNDFIDNATFPDAIHYKIRFPAAPRANSDLVNERFGIKKIWFTEIIYPVVQLLGPRALDQPTGGVPGYYEEGFLYIQNAVESTLTELLSNNASLLDNYAKTLRRFPYPSFIDDKFLYTLQGVLPLTLILSFIFPVINITKLIVVEKEQRLKEYMLIMGLKNWLCWTSWFIKCFSYLAISVLIITVLLKVRVLDSQLLAILPKSDPTLIYFCFMVHIFQLVTFAFFISTLFKTANSAAIVAAMLWFIFFLPFAFVQPRYNQIPWSGKMAWSFLTNIAICFICSLFCSFEGAGTGAQWETIWMGAAPNDSFSIGNCVVMMAVNGLIYLVLTIYVEAVWPGEYGVPLPWYFPFMKWYWTGAMRYPPSPTAPPPLTPNEKNAFFEPASSKCKPGIQIHGLTKRFGKSKVAVNNLNLEVFENEIFTLIGHNAAGKTTTMSLLSGIYPPTSGTAVVNGCDITKDMGTVRRSLGLCPQSNILFQELTVEEHLRFFSILKGVASGGAVEEEVQRILCAIGLDHRKDALASQLSGGMQRRLSVGVAFVGGSSIVLLDEPSSGLDPASRRQMWDLIGRERKGRTILLSTHYMDEAEIIGDRIAIMADGVAVCCGSSLFLKKKYGCGYHLVIVKESHCNVPKIREVLEESLEGVEEEGSVGAELSYALPENQSHLFAKVFKELEERRTELGIASYGVGIKTLEEIFTRVGQLTHKEQSTDSLQTNGLSQKPKDSPNSVPGVNVTFLNGSKMRSKSSSDFEEGEGESEERNTGFLLRLQQFWAMIAKKFAFVRRRCGLLIGQIAICVIYPSLVLLVLTTIPGIYDPPSHPIVIEDYEYFGNTTTLLHCQEESPTCVGARSYLRSRGKLTEDVWENETVASTVLKLGEEDIVELNTKYFLGYEETYNESSGKTEIRGLFNNQPLHTPPLALNFLSNAILNSFGTTRKEITVTNHPFGYAVNFEDLGNYFTVGFQLGMHLALAVGFMASVYAVFPIKERTVGSKHLQFVSGAHYLGFWISTFIVDLISFCLPILSILAILVLFRVEDFYSVTVQLYLLLLFYCYAFAVLPLAYLSSFLFEIPSSGLVGLGVFNVLTGYASLFVANILGNPELDRESLATTLHRAFLIIPTYSLGKGITQISLNYQVGKACQVEFLDLLCATPPETKSVLDWCCNKLKPDYLNWDELGIGKNLTALVIVGLVCWTILLVTDSGIFSKTGGRFRRKLDLLKQSKKWDRYSTFPPRNSSNEDEEVGKERRRIENSNIEELCATDNLVIRDLSKEYPNGTVAVDRISLGLKRGDGFALIGANGAGKTSTFKMLTGELTLSGGNAYVCGSCIRTQLKEAHKAIGYCPQFDSLLEEMTGRETLAMYARLRGIPERSIRRVSLKLAEELLFTEFLDKPVQDYSGGNKRKLSFAIAVIGNPQIVFLDEPTCGIDAVAKREVWAAISRIRKAGTTVLLTTHSLEEAETLCSRVGIMVNGRFRCLGSPQQLKSKFGEGYTLTAQVALTENDVEDDVKRRRKMSGQSSISGSGNHSKIEELQGFIEASLPGCALEDIHQGFLHYRVHSQHATWPQLFTVMEAAKEKFKLEAYCVGQTSLEQVFLNFIKAQVASE